MNFIYAIFPVVVLILGLVASIQVWGVDSIKGPSQFLLLLAGFVAIFPQLTDSLRKKKVADFVTALTQSIRENIKNVQIAIWILFLVGALIGSWSVSGILPGMILVGLKTIRPDLFLVGACFASGIVSLASGSSWSTVGTIGVALMGLGEVWNFPPGLVAGAILSGAYFGDKMSALSDTTNLASGICKIPLSSHIRFMLPTTSLSILLSLLLYAIIGISFNQATMETVQLESRIEAAFPLYYPSFLVPLFVILFVSFGLPAIPCLVFGVMGGVAIAFGIRGQSFPLVIESLIFGYESILGDSNLDELLSGGGVLSMLPTVILILSAMVFGACMEYSGKMDRIIAEILKFATNPRKLIYSTMGFCVFANLTTSDQYLSVVIPGKTLKPSYERMNMDLRYLSRALEDSGTITSVLIPWNSCGVFMSTSLGILTIVYLPFCFFHWIHLAIAIINTKKMRNFSVIA